MTPEQKIAAKVAADKKADKKAAGSPGPKAAADKAAADKVAADKAAADKVAADKVAADKVAADKVAADKAAADKAAADKAAAKNSTFTPKKGDEHLIHVRIYRGPKFDSQTGEPIKQNSYVQNFELKDFKNFEKNASSLGYNYSIIYKPKGV